MELSLHPKYSTFFTQANQDLALHLKHKVFKILHLHKDRLSSITNKTQNNSKPNILLPSSQKAEYKI